MNKYCYIIVDFKIKRILSSLDKRFKLHQDDGKERIYIDTKYNGIRFYDSYNLAEAKAVARNQIKIQCKRLERQLNSLVNINSRNMLYKG